MKVCCFTAKGRRKSVWQGASQWTEVFLAGGSDCEHDTKQRVR